MFLLTLRWLVAGDHSQFIHRYNIMHGRPGMFISGIKNKIMETKTIRFEKGTIYGEAQLKPYFKEYHPMEYFLWVIHGFECLKSFTVQINIIEDDQDNKIPG